jgi:tyrosine-protein kinase Etk/Wzc
MSEDAAGRAAADEDEISFLDLAVVIAKHKKLVLGLPFVVGILAIIVTLLLPVTFTSTAKILPPQQNQSSALAMLGQLTSQAGALGSLAGGALGIRNPNEMYIGMMKSRTIADNLIDRFDLRKIYGAQLYMTARDILQGRTSITTSKDGIITIEVDDRDPKRAAELANGYIEELYKLTQVLAVTEASQRRLFFERQLALARKNLNQAENAARKALDEGGLAAVDAQSRAVLETTSKLRGAISVKEIQVGAMRAFAAERNPDLQQAQLELDSMKRELARMEGRTGSKEIASGGGASEGMDNLKLIRELKYNEVVYELLARQYEVAKIDEAKDASLIQVLDKPMIPEHKSKPKRAVIVVLAVLAAGFIAILWAFVAEAMEKVRRDPESAGRLDLLRHYLKWRQT